MLSASFLADKIVGDGEDNPEPPSSGWERERTMAEWTTEQLEEMSRGVLALFEDGFQFSDIFQVVPKVMEIVALAKGTTGPEKKELAIMLGEYVIDKTDFPWIPDAIVDPICKKLLPGAVQMAWDASKGKFAFGGNDEAEE